MRKFYLPNHFCNLRNYSPFEWGWDYFFWRKIFDRGSQSQSSLQVHKVGFERVVYLLAFRYPLAYGLLAVLMAVSAGLLAYTFFRRRD